MPPWGGWEGGSECGARACWRAQTRRRTAGYVRCKHFFRVGWGVTLVVGVTGSWLRLPGRLPPTAHGNDIKSS